MLSAEELLEYRKKSVPSVIPLGSKLTTPSPGPCLQLEKKLENMEELLTMERVRMTGLLSNGVWHHELNKAEIIKHTGPYWDVLGHSIGGKLFLYPEEALFLIDVGALDLTYNNVTLSLQRAYYLLLHETGITFDQYRVFQHLFLLGYKVMRHSTHNVLSKYEKDLEVHKIGIKHRNQGAIGKHSTLNSSEDIKNSKLEDDLSSWPIFYKTEDNRAEVLKRLQAIGPKPDDLDLKTEDAKVDFDIYTRKDLQKSVVQLPDYRITVFSGENTAPDLEKLGRLQHYFQDQVPHLIGIVYIDSIHFIQINQIIIPEIIN